MKCHSDLCFGRDPISEYSTVHSCKHYNDIIMSTMASQITSLTIVYSAVYSGADQRKDQSSASLAFVRGIHRWPVNSTHKWPVRRKMLPFDVVIMKYCGYPMNCMIPPIFARGRENVIMMTSSNGNIFRVTDRLCGEFTGHRWIPRTKASDAELWCFLSCAIE